MHKGEKTAISLLWELAAPLILYMVVSDMTLYACHLLGNGISAKDMLKVNAVGAALAALPLGLWYRETKLRRKLTGGQRAQRKRLQTDFGAVILLAAGASIAFNEMLMLFPIPSAAYEQANEFLNAPSLLVQLVCTGLVIPLAEELVFRGLLYEGLREHTSAWRAALISSVCFGLFHGNVVQGIYAALLGVLLALLYEWYDSLAAAWLFHAAANLTSVLMTHWEMQQRLAKSPPGMLLAAAGGGIVMVGAFYKIKERKNI